jgi:hypothetical protein
VIAKPFFLTKDNCRISAKILPDNKTIRDHGGVPADSAERGRPMVPKRPGVTMCGPIATVAAAVGSDSRDRDHGSRPAGTHGTVSPGRFLPRRARCAPGRIQAG